MNVDDIVMVTDADGNSHHYTVAKVAAKGGLTLRPLRWTDGPAKDENGSGWRLTSVDCLHVGDVISVDPDAIRALQPELEAERATAMDWRWVGLESMYVTGARIYPHGLDRCDIKVIRRRWDDTEEADETTANGGDECLVWRP